MAGKHGSVTGWEERGNQESVSGQPALSQVLQLWSRVTAGIGCNLWVLGRTHQVFPVLPDRDIVDVFAYVLCYTCLSLRQMEYVSLFN